MPGCREDCLYGPVGRAGPRAPPIIMPASFARLPCRPEKRKSIAPPPPRAAGKNGAPDAAPPTSSVGTQGSWASAASSSGDSERLRGDGLDAQQLDRVGDEHRAAEPGADSASRGEAHVGQPPAQQPPAPAAAPIPLSVAGSSAEPMPSPAAAATATPTSLASSAAAPLPTPGESHCPFYYLPRRDFGNNSSFLRAKMCPIRAQKELRAGPHQSKQFWSTHGVVWEHGKHFCKNLAGAAK